MSMVGPVGGQSDPPMQTWRGRCKTKGEPAQPVRVLRQLLVIGCRLARVEMDDVGKPLWLHPGLGQPCHARCRDEVHLSGSGLGDAETFLNVMDLDDR